MIRKLRFKFICINMLIVIIFLNIILVPIMISTKARMEEDNTQMMRRISSGHWAPLSSDEPNSDTNLPFFMVTLDDSGQILSRVGGYDGLSDESLLPSMIKEVQQAGSETGILEEYNLRYFIRESRNETVIVFWDITSESKAVTHLFTVCILLGIAGLALFLIVSILLARWAIRPVEQAWEQQKQFVSDASHELKTPLTVILTDAELLQSDSCKEADRSRFLASIQEMAVQMRGLVEEMLSLTRADNPEMKKAQHPLDLSECVTDALLPFEPVFFEKGLSLGEEIESGIHVNGNEEQLSEVVGILLDNAQKYSLPASETTVVLTKQGKSALLKVSSRGEEISREDLQNIFRRFYRLDKARSMNHSYGLGLAIARQIVESHKGKIWAESQGGVNTFCVQLPRRQPSRT